MKIAQIQLLITILVFGLASYLQAYEVIDGSKNGYKVKAEDYATVTTPDQQMIRVTSFLFVTPNSDTAPSERVGPKYYRLLSDFTRKEEVL